jgi:hypothetical protein
MSDLITVMNLTSRTYVLSAPLGMKEETLRVGDNRIPRAVWEHSVKCSPSLGRESKLFVVPEAPARVERTSEPVALPEVVNEPAGAPSLASMSVSEAKRAIEQTTDLDVLEAWTSDSRKAVASAAQRRLDHLMVTP